MGRQLNHMEFVHRPGEAPLVHELFDVLGIESFDGMFLVGDIDPATANHVDNIIVGSEARPEQLAFDDALAGALHSESLAGAFQGYQDLLDRAPQYGMHVGIRFDSLDEWHETVARLTDVDRRAPALANRVRLCGVIPPGHPASVSGFVHQAFLWTDVLACGSLALGQHLELQHVDFAAMAAARTREEN
jgi:hypothetical protein